MGVRILTRVQKGALRVPVSAVFAWPGAPERLGVFVLADGHARLRPVVLGGCNGQHAWLTQGLAAGDKVLIYPPAQVSNGSRVQARQVGAAPR